MYSRLCCKYLQTCEWTYKINGVMKFSSTYVDNKVDEKLNNSQLNGKVKSTRHIKDIYDYVNSKDSLKRKLPDIPSRLLSKRIKSPEGIYLIDSDVAEEVFDIMRSDLLPSHNHIIEVNPGLGLLTQKLLAAKIRKLRLFEADQQFFVNLKNVISESKIEDIDILHVNFNNFWSLTYQDKMDDGNRLENIMNGLPKMQWENEEPVFKIIGALPDHKLIRYFIFSTFFQNGISQYGRPEMYIILPPSSYIRLTCNSEAGYFLYRSLPVLFQLIFEAELLKKVPCKAFVPWRTVYVPQKKSKLSKINRIDEEFLYLVKIKGRRNLYSEIIPPHLLKPLWYFVHHHMVKRSSKIIPQMELWVPGCGPRLISKGLTIFNEFGDLSPFQILDLFLYFYSWPEFSTCPFLHSMEARFMKMEEPGHSDDLEDDDHNDDESNICCERHDHNDIHGAAKQL